MGGELPSRSGAEGGPTFAVYALRDPGTDARAGTLLQRVQIIKGWADDGRMFRQEVHDVAGEPNNGARVDPAMCTP